MIYLQPHSGLGNRFRVMISGLHLADVVQHQLTIIWRKDKSLFCDFTDLYEIDDKIILKQYNWRNRIFNSVQSIKFLSRIFAKAFSIDFSLFDKDVREYVWDTGTNNINLSKLPVKVSNYYFSTCHEFYFDRSYISHLRPIKIIQENINKNVARFNSKTIGVHIRRTDHTESINGSPLKSFIDTIRTDLLKDSSLNYFLATDDKEVEITLKKIFPGNIITYEKVYSRMNVEGIQDAMVDLYSLASTTKIYGSYFSSFSDMAARIGNIQLEIIQ